MLHHLVNLSFDLGTTLTSWYLYFAAGSDLWFLSWFTPKSDKLVLCANVRAAEEIWA